MGVNVFDATGPVNGFNAKGEQFYRVKEMKGYACRLGKITISSLTHQDYRSFSDQQLIMEINSGGFPHISTFRCGLAADIPVPTLVWCTGRKDHLSITVENTEIS